MRAAGLVLASSAFFAAVLCLVARVTGLPFVFPALGASAFLFVTAPRAPTSSAKNAVSAYAMAVVFGYLPLLILGLDGAPPEASGQLSLTRALAVALALGLTGAAMALTELKHPPASAATVMVALGIVRGPAQLAAVEAAIVVLVGAATLFNRAAARLDGDRDGATP